MLYLQTGICLHEGETLRGCRIHQEFKGPEASVGEVLRQGEGGFKNALAQALVKGRARRHF